MPDVYRVGVIGTSWATRGPLQTFQAYPRTEVRAVCSGRLERAREVAGEFGVPVAVDDYRRLVESPDVDIVYVATPVYLHADMAAAALEAGKHVLCEKPLAVDAAQARRLVDMAQRHGRAHVVAFTMRHFATSLAMRRVIDDGRLGEVRHVAASLLFGARGGGERPWTWLDSAALGGGMLGAVGSHYIDLTRWLVGEFDQVWGSVHHWRSQAPAAGGALRPVTADEAFVAGGRLGNGALVSIQLNTAIRPGAGGRFEIHGSDGSLVLEGERLTLAPPGGEPQLLETPEPEWPAEVAATPVPRFALMIHKLVAGIGGDREGMAPNFVDGLRCQEVIDAVKRG